MEGALVAGSVDGAVHSTEHGGPNIEQGLRWIPELSSAARHWVPDHELHGHITIVEEDAAMAAVANRQVSQLGVKSARGQDHVLETKWAMESVSAWELL